MQKKNHSNHQGPVKNYYKEVSLDYKGWSSGYNMHFGHYQFKGLKQGILLFFNRESQLEQTNHKVLSQLNIQPHSNYLDMGCGLGATARVFSKKFPSAHLDAITISDYQVDEAKKLFINQPPFTNPTNITFHVMDYQKTIFDDEYFDGLYNIESACHAQERSKSLLIKEAYRLLKPEGK